VSRQIKSLGWEETDRGDPWVVLFEKPFPESQRDPEGELRSLMGDYWLTADDMRALRGVSSSAS
jgi:hypothetical protein